MRGSLDPSGGGTGDAQEAGEGEFEGGAEGEREETLSAVACRAKDEDC